MRRVVVTGIGMVTPLAWGAEKTWSALLAGKSGAGRISAFDVTDYLPAQGGGREVPRKFQGAAAAASRILDGSFDPDQVMSPREQRRIDDFILYAMAAADEAVKDANWKPEDETERRRTGT